MFRPSRSMMRGRSGFRNAAYRSFRPCATAIDAGTAIAPVVMTRCVVGGGACGSTVLTCWCASTVGHDEADLLDAAAVASIVQPAHDLAFHQPQLHEPCTRAHSDEERAARDAQWRRHGGNTRTDALGPLGD